MRVPTYYNQTIIGLIATQVRITMQLRKIRWGPKAPSADIFHRCNGEVANDIESACSLRAHRTKACVEYQQVSIVKAKELGALIPRWIPVSKGLKLRVVVSSRLAVSDGNALCQHATVARRQIAEVKTPRTHILRIFRYRNILEPAVRKDRSQRAAASLVYADSQ